MPEQNLKIALIPHAIIEGRPEENIKAVESRLAEVDADTDLVVLPEMFNAGYTTAPELLRKVAEGNDGPTILAVRRWVEKFGFAVWGGFTARNGENFYNRGFMAMPDGTVEFYDKRHLFRAGGEQMILTPGMALPPVVNFRTWKLCMSICYDIRFPVWNRNVDLRYDALIVPANWAHSRVFAWKHMLIARAVENQAFVAGCNREGTDLWGEYPRGDSFIFNNWGDDIAERRDNGIVYATFDAQRLSRDRQRFSPWQDADDFQLIID